LTHREKPFTNFALSHASYGYATGVEGTFAKIAALCSKEVTPSGIPCCGMVGLWTS
jgi:hypothetical protein